MKSFLFIALFAANFAYAQDMSRTETYDQSHRDNDDGTTSYIGGCSLHEDYENQLFTVTSTVVDYFEPGYRDTEEQVLARLTKIEPKLLAKVREDVGEGFPFVDDLTLVKLRHKRFPGMDLFRFSIGVGGGNGMYITYKKVGGEFIQLAHTFDGDLNFCDRQVWIR